MKVAIIGPAHPLRGGLSTFNQKLAEEYIKLGHECHLISFTLQYPNFLFPGKTQYSEDTAPNLTIHTIINSINPLNWIKSGNIIKKQKYDLVIFRYWLPFMSPCFGTIARIIKKNKHTKIATIADNIFPHEKRPFDVIFTKYFVKPIDVFVTMSRKVLEDLKEFTNSPKEYVPHPMYDNFGELINKNKALNVLNLDEKYNYLLFFGFIRKYKGLDLMLESMHELKKMNLPIKLIVAGEFYEDSKPYFELIEKLNLQNEVIMHNDFIPNDKVNLYFSACDLVVQTYHNATQSGVTQIAYHFNKPMLVTNVGGLSETVPHEKVGYVCEKEPKEISQFISDFYTKNKQIEFENNIKEYKKNFSWLNLIDTFNNLIKR